MRGGRCHRLLGHGGRLRDHDDDHDDCAAAPLTAVRTRTRLITVAVGLLALLAAVGPAPAAPVLTARDVTGTPDPVVAGTAAWATGLDVSAHCAPNALVPGAGGACFDVPSGVRSAAVTVADASGRMVSGRVWFEDGRGRRLMSSSRFCRGVMVAVPAGALRAVVTVDTTVIGCGLRHGGPATAGTISLALDPPDDHGE